jgi:putative spermidine/putrescine transport system ATP-binding protein
MSALTYTSARKTFGEIVALEGLDLAVEPGELISLLGPSGCGKTTALRIAAGFEKADSGSVSLDGVDISHKPAHKRNMGMVFQSYSLFPNLNVALNVDFGLRTRKIPSLQRKHRVNEMLELVQLTEFADRYPHQLSGGQQQRVALARALAVQPEVLLLDEPLSALDAKVRLQLRDEIRRIQTELGITTLLVTHDQEEALGISIDVAEAHRRAGWVVGVGADAEVVAGRAQHGAARPRFGGRVEEVGRIAVGLRDLVGDGVPVDLAPPSRERLWHAAVVVAEQVLVARDDRGEVAGAAHDHGLRLRAAGTGRARCSTHDEHGRTQQNRARGAHSSHLPQPPRRRRTNSTLRVARSTWTSRRLHGADSPRRSLP